MLTVIAICIFGCFQVYRPFTHYEAISNKQVQRRAIVASVGNNVRELRQKSILVVPSKGPPTRPGVGSVRDVAGFAHKTPILPILRFFCFLF